MFDLKTFCRDIHQSNIIAGWWSDLNTGASILATRNRPEMLMLVVSELSEASEGAQCKLYDDKLPHRPMFDVELADAAIRLGDLLGADAVAATLTAAMSDWETRVGAFSWTASTDDDRSLMGIVNLVSAAMEDHRKGRAAQYAQHLVLALAAVFGLAQSRGIELLDIIAEKRAYNAKRADHQIANRKAAGGKAY